MLAHGAQPLGQLGLGLLECILDPLEPHPLLTQPLHREAEQSLQLIFGDRQLLLMAQPTTQRLAPQGRDLLLALTQTLQRRHGTSLLLAAALLLALALAHRLTQLFESLLPLQLHLTAGATTETLLTTQTQGTELLL